MSKEVGYHGPPALAWVSRRRESQARPVSVWPTIRAIYYTTANSRPGARISAFMFSNLQRQVIRLEYLYADQHVR